MCPKKRADFEAIFGHLNMADTSNVNKELVENLLSQVVNFKLIINKKTHTSLDSFCFITEIQKMFLSKVKPKTRMMFMKKI